MTAALRQAGQNRGRLAIAQTDILQFIWIAPGQSSAEHDPAISADPTPEIGRIRRVERDAFGKPERSQNGFIDGFSDASVSEGARDRGQPILVEDAVYLDYRCADQDKFVNSVVLVEKRSAHGGRSRETQGERARLDDSSRHVACDGDRRVGVLPR